jgi:hypothetical protein
MAEINLGASSSPENSRERQVFRKAIDFTVRNVLEFVVSVYVLGALPLIMHCFVALIQGPPPTASPWVPAEAWLIVMVTCGSALSDAWRERRRSDDTLNAIGALFGLLGMAFGALAYALLTINSNASATVTPFLVSAVWYFVAIIAVLYLAYRLPALYRTASEDAERAIPRGKTVSKRKGG